MGILDSLIKDGILMFTPVGDIVSKGVSILSSGLDKIITSIDKANKKKIEKYVASLNNAPFFLIKIPEYEDSFIKQISPVKLTVYDENGKNVGLIELRYKKCFVNYNNRRIASINVKEKFLSQKETYTVTYDNQRKDIFICENGVYHAYHKLEFNSDKYSIKQSKDSSSKIYTKDEKEIICCKRLPEVYIISYANGLEKEALIFSSVPWILLGKGSSSDYAPGVDF